MKLEQFEIHSGEKILLQANHNRKWYLVTWKIVSGFFGVAILAFIVYGLLGNPTDSGLATFLPQTTAHLLSVVLYVGLIPLAGIAWVIEDLAATYIAEFILTDQRLWVRGSPYAWSVSDIPLNEIASMTWRRDALFLRQRSSRKIQVHMFTEGKRMVQIYKEMSEGNQ